MSYDFDVFVSYASVDGREFVADLVARLRSSGLRVWFDQEQMRVGDQVTAALADGLRRSRHAVFVLTRGWQQSDYTNWELSVFREQDKTRRRLPLSLIGPPRDEDLGPRLSGLKWLDWFAHDDPDLSFWEVFCGLTLEELGPPAGWKARAQQAQAKVPLLGSATTAPPPRDERRAADVIEVEAPLAFGCDRAHQWGALTTHAATKRSEAIFVVGPLREAHDAFLKRIQNCLSKDPPRRIVSIRWDPPYTPIGRGEFIAALQRAFGCRDEKHLIAELRAQLTDQNVLLVHRPVAQDAFDRDDLVDYYSKWLPDLVAQADPEALTDDRIFGLKAIQAIAWTPASMLDGLRGLLPWGTQRAASSAKVSKSAAEQLLGSLKAAANPAMPLVFLEPLPRITVEDVKNWCDALPPHYDRERMVAQIMSDAPDSAAILEKIGALLANDRRSEP